MLTPSFTPLHSASLPQPLSVAAEQTREQQRLRKRMADAGKNAAKTLLEQIEVSFSAAQKPISSLVHPQKPGLKAVEITPVLPGFGMWGDNFAIMSFDHDPDDDVPKVEGGGERDVGQAVLMASQMEEKEDDELSYRRSSKKGAAAAAAAAAAAGADEGGRGARTRGRVRRSTSGSVSTSLT